MSWLFDTSALSELMRPRPNRRFVEWLGGVPEEDQFTSTLVLGELHAGAWRSPDPDRWLRRIAEEIVPRVRVLPFDAESAAIYGRLKADLLSAGTPIGEMDTLIGAAGLRWDLAVVTANATHFRRIEGLRLVVPSPGEGGGLELEPPRY